MTNSEIYQKYIPNLKHKSGSEYSSPCPKCGGNDRFIINMGTGRFWCRGCSWNGDYYDTIQHFENCNFKEAKKILGEPIEKRSSSLSGKPKVEQIQLPYRDDQPEPNNIWKQKAEEIVSASYSCLCYSKDDEYLRKWLKLERLFEPYTIHNVGIGHNPKDLYLPCRDFGIDSDKKLIIPEGLIIPTVGVNGIERLRIRRKTLYDGNRYHFVKGSKCDWSSYGKFTDIGVFVESDLDAILINQETGLRTYASTSASLPPSKKVFEQLKQHSILFDALDSDNAGDKLSLKLKATLSQYFRLPPLRAKDPTEMVKTGVPIKAWIDAGLSLAGKQKDGNLSA